MTDIYKQNSIPLDLRPLDNEETFKNDLNESFNESTELNLTPQDPEFTIYSDRMNNARQARILEKSLIDDDEALYQEQWAKKIGQDMKVPGSIILGNGNGHDHDMLNFNQYALNNNESFGNFNDDNVMQIPTTLTVKQQPKFESYKDADLSVSFVNPDVNESNDQKFINLNAPPRTIRLDSRLDRPEEDVKSHDETFKTSNEDIDKNNQIIVDKILGLEELNELFVETQDSELVRNQLFQMSRRLYKLELTNRELDNALKNVKMINYGLLGLLSICVIYKLFSRPQYY